MSVISLHVYCAKFMACVCVQQRDKPHWREMRHDPHQRVPSRQTVNAQYEQTDCSRSCWDVPCSTAWSSEENPKLRVSVKLHMQASQGIRLRISVRLVTCVYL